VGNEFREGEAVRVAIKALIADGKGRQALAQEKKEREAFEKAAKRVAAGVSLLACSDAQLALGDFGKALKAASTAVAAFKQLRHTRGQVMALHQLGEAQKPFNDGAAMLETVKQAVPLLRELLDDKEEARIMEIKSHAHQVLGDARRAMEATRAGLECSRSCQDRIGEGAALNNIANAYLMMPDRMEEALQAAREAFVHCSATGNKREAAFAAGAMASAFYTLGRLDDALLAQRELLRIAGERGDDQQIASAAEGVEQLTSAISVGA